MFKTHSTEIESWRWEEEGKMGNSFQVVVWDDATAKIVAKGPIRDTRSAAKQDDQDLRSGKIHVRDWQK